MIRALLLVAAVSFAAQPWKDTVARGHFEEGRKYQDQAVYPFAIDQFQMSLAKEPRPETERALGECFAAMEQPLLAAAHFARYVKDEPKDAEILVRLGGLYLKLGKLEEARDTFRALKAVDAESARTGLMQVELKLGEQAYSARKFEKAAGHFRAAEAESGGDPRALEWLAKCKRALGESDGKKGERKKGDGKKGESKKGESKKGESKSRR